MCISFGTNYNRSRTTYLLERKGKKEKDAVAGVPDNRETLPGIIIKVRKHKRIKDAEIPVESENISANPEVEEKGKKKKQKRDRRDEEQPSEEKKKKKQKKDTTSVDTSDYATSSVLATMAVDTSEAKPKAKEKKRTESKQLTEPSDPSPSDIDPTLGAEVAHLCTESSSRPKSKSRKRKKDVTPEDQEQSTAARAEDHSSRKRKRSNLSTYLDPSDDPNLADQSQKGTHLRFRILNLIDLSFDRISPDLRLLPFHLAQNLEVQQGSSELDIS